MRRAAVVAVALALALAGCVTPVTRQRTAEAAAPSSAAAPQPLRTLATLIAEAPGLSRFRALAAAGGLDRLMTGRGRVTVLAPTDAAFVRLPTGTVEALLLPGNRPSLLHLLRYWVVPGDTLHTAVGGQVRVPTLDDEPVTVITGPGLTIASDAAGRRGAVDAREATDGTLALLDGVIAPRSIEPRRPAFTIPYSSTPAKADAR